MVEHLKDTINKANETVQEGLQKRFGDPFLSTFTIVYAIWNFEIFLLAFSDLDARLKINAITETLVKDPILNLIPSSIYYPALLTAFVVLVSPFLFSKLYEIAFMNTTRVENAKLKAQQKLLPLQSELKNMQEQLNAEKVKSNELNIVISEKDNRIGALEQKELDYKKKLAELEKKFNDQGQKNNQIATKLTNSTTSNDSIEKNRKIIKELNIHLDFLLTPKEFSKKRSLNSNETINAYLACVEQLADPVFNDNLQSAKMKNTYTYYTHEKNRRSFSNMSHYITEALGTPALQSEEKERLTLAYSLLSELVKYTA